MPDFGATGSLPTSLQNTLWLRGTALSAVGRPGMENLDATRKKKGEKKGAGKIYVPIHICGSEHFLNAFNTLTEPGRALRQILKSESERKKQESNSSLRLRPNNRIICCTAMTSYTTRSLKLSCLIKIYFAQPSRGKVRHYQNTKRCVTGLCLHKRFTQQTFPVNVFWSTHMLLFEACWSSNCKHDTD